MSSPSEDSHVNGRISPDADDRRQVVIDRDESDSDLSDVQAVDTEAQYRDSEDVQDSVVARPQLILQSPSETSENDAADDADFDMIESPASAGSDIDHDGPSVANGSRPAPKRKAAVLTEDDYMRENPELYGLRRSVRI
jgi:chromodomain-helicase-DNA-binding protein 1